MTAEEGTRTMTPRILAFADSLRRESFNKQLVPIAAKGARDAGADVTLIGLEDFPWFSRTFDDPTFAGRDSAMNVVPYRVSIVYG
jgi:hypothetical protein